MYSDPQSPDNDLQNLQHQLVILLRDSNYFSFDDIHLYWQEYINATVDWNVILRSGKTQADLAGELVATATQNGNLEKFAAVILKTKKHVISGHFLSDDHEKSRQLKDDICKIITDAKEMDFSNIRRCYLESLPQGVELPITIKNNDSLRNAVYHLVEQYGGDKDKCCILEFLQLLRVTETKKLLIPLSAIVDRVCAFYKIDDDTKKEKYREMEERKKTFHLHPLTFVLKFENDLEKPPSEKCYSINLRFFMRGNFISKVDLAESVQLQSENDLASLLTRLWLSKIDPYIQSCIDNEKPIFIIVVPKELLAWNIDLLEIKKDSESSTSISKHGLISYCCFDRYRRGSDRKIRLHEHWERIKPKYARVENVFEHKEDNEITRSLQECDTKSRWASCLVEGRSSKHVCTDIECLYESGVPAMAWIRNTAVAQDAMKLQSDFISLFPQGNFHQQNILNYVSCLSEKAKKKKVSSSSIAFLLDHPDYKEDGII